MSIKMQDFIHKSKRLCELAGMDPDEIRKPSVTMTKVELEQKKESYNEILEVVTFFSHKFLQSLKGTPILMVLSDENGYILDVVGDETIKSTISQLGIKSGSQFTQEDMGTNVISLALQERHPIQLIGDDHYHKVLHGTACYGVAFHYIDIDNLLGSISIMTTIEQQNPLFLNMLSNLVDSIERELLLRKQNRKLNIMNQIMLSRTRNAIIITDATGKITEYNRFAEKISGFDRNEIIGRDILKSPITGKYFKEVLKAEKKFEDVEMKFKNNNGESMICLFDAQPIYDSKNSAIIGAFAQLRDITERYIMQERYNYLAFHDELTGLPNRRYFNSELTRLIKENSVNTDVSLLLIDLDRFKIVNDTFGHSNGDRLLKAVSKRINQCLRKGDFVSRISGDEFIVVLKNVKRKQDAVRVADKIVKQFKKPFTINKNIVHTSASIGIAFYNNGMNIDEYMVQVDHAMYKAKSQGKNGYVIFTPEMYQDTSEELLLEAHLRKAVEKNEFALYYQPQVDIRTGEIIGLEALIRWYHPKLGIIPPSKFISLAEKTGLIIPIGEWVLEEACRQNKSWQDQGFPRFKVSVNLSTQQFLKQNLIEMIKKILEKTKLEPRYLELEITESIALEYKNTTKILGELSDIGVSISMDDFGTGYSSLSYLKHFSMGFLKIDKSFVSDILTDENDAKIVASIITMAHALGLKVIAEGVEEIEQLRYLSNQECDIVQGYYFMKPISSHSFEEKFSDIVDEIKKKSSDINGESS